MFPSLLLCLALSVAGPQKQAQISDSPVMVPQWANSTCPVMGKPISLRLFTDTRYGRIYICCKVCVKDIHEDVDAAYAASYPTNTVVENKLCPVTGREITKDSPKVVLQGHEFRAFDKAAAAKASEDAQVTLCRLLEPKWESLDNRTCPVTGEPVATNTIAVYKQTIVRLSSPKAVDEFRKAPDKVLEKAKAIRQKELEEARKQEKPAEKPAPKAPGSASAP